MSKPKFTPGPWKIVDDDFIYVLNDPKDPRERCNRMWLQVHRGHGDDDKPIPIEEVAATARLIAAAPELYDLILSLYGNASLFNHDSDPAWVQLKELVKALMRRINEEEPF